VTRPADDLPGLRLRRLPTDELTPVEIGAIRALMTVAFGDDEEERFTEEDWHHSIGGMHFVLDVDGLLVTHASVVEREIQVDRRPLRTGYVEAVATAPEREGAGFGSIVIGDVTAFIRDRFELGMLGTGRHHFYERLGWVVWPGPAFVRTDDGLRRTPDEEGDLLVLRTPATPPLDDHAPISCDWRPGDVW
jgi:aminoglycoside 2'-N-acetyltransferase I